MPLTLCCPLFRNRDVDLVQLKAFPAIEPRIFPINKVHIAVGVGREWKRPMMHTTSCSGFLLIGS